MQAVLADSVPQGVLQVVSDCSHVIQLCRPELISDAIRTMVEVVRERE